jgi:predicted transposase/invertase (TIGR01784 family)
MLLPRKILLGQHDLSYRLFFSHARMVCDLLREMIGEDWVKLLDFSSAERVNASFVSETRRNRESDVIWKFRRRDTGDPVYVYVLLEFQSRPDRYMPVRLMTYTGMLYETLIAEGRLGPSGRLPQVIPIVIYNGLGAWGTPLDLAELIERFDPSVEAYVPHLRYKLLHEAAYSAEELEKQSPVADLFRLEQSTSWEDVLFGVERLEEHVELDEEPELYRAFVGWLREVISPRLGATPDEIPQGLTFKEFRAMLAERIDSWTERDREKSRQEGLQQGQQLGEAKALLRVLERRFGSVDQAIRERIASADSDLLLELIDRSSTAESLADVFSG